ncbi:MAG: glycosyltransferase family 4 protein [Pseudomonadota bacterium]
MKLVAVSEHFFPRVGGTVNYVHETLSALARHGVDVELWVPGPEPEDPYPAGMAQPDYRVNWINADYPATGNPSRVLRYRFCRLVNELALHRIECDQAPDVVHVVFGLFVMEILDTKSLRQAGVRSVATVHNLPPHECRVVSPDAGMIRQLRETIRLMLVGWKNNRRLRQHVYDRYIVPSEQVFNLAKRVIPQQKIETIGHGPTGSLMNAMKPPLSRAAGSGKPVRILTAGGYAPHKRQHLIPEAAEQLKALGVGFEWDVVGPDRRIPGYREMIEQDLSNRKLSGTVRLHGAVPFDSLALLYDKANIFVQPSIEEGFCITALDAAAAGLPVIASRAGALAQITAISKGALVESKASVLAAKIFEFVENDRWGDPQVTSKSVIAEFSWQRAASKLREIYEDVVGAK